MARRKSARRLGGISLEVGHAAATRSPHNAAMRALVLRRGALGDTLILLPILEALAATGRVTTLDCAGSSDFVPLFAAHGLVRRAFSSESLALHRTLRGEGLGLLADYDIVIGERALPDGDARNLDFDVHIDANGEVAASRQLFDRFARAWRARFETELEHDGRLRLMAKSPARPPRSPKRLWVQLGAGSPKRVWPGLEPAGPQLISSWLDRGIDVTVGVGPADEGLGRLALDARAQWARSPDIVQLAAGIASAALYIGHDTGPSHLAAATATPTIVLHGPLTPTRVWLPLGLAPTTAVAWTDKSTSDVSAALDALVCRHFGI